MSDFSSLRIHFEQRLDQHESGCWLWKNVANKKTGYGEYYVGVGFGERYIGAHRASWLIYRGAIPHGMHICHKCDVRNCVNPAHLFIGTVADNIQDCLSKGRNAAATGRHGQWLHPERTARGSRQGAARLTEELIPAIVKMRADGESYEAIAARYGVNRSTISRAIQGKTWAHVSP